MFGQFVVGPPGSGKSTYCAGMKEFLTAIERDVVLINLDPANENLPYKCDIDIRELIGLEEVMAEFGLGPNGALIYCMEYLAKNISWLEEELKREEGKYIIIDFPGQVELFTHHKACQKIADLMTNDWNYRMCSVLLVDAHLCTDPHKYISCILMVCSTMLHLETPHVSFLSKCDLIEKYGKLKFGLQYYTSVLDTKYLIPHLTSRDDKFARRHKKLSKRIAEVVEDFGLVSFSPLSVVEKKSMKNAVELVDKANGYVKLPKERQAILNSIGTDTGLDNDAIQYFQDKYINHSQAQRDEAKISRS
mmetsp:Transcript_24880/g.59835  ORF Transcript_24880/g.59835 Transcript_24880/m.59835 type:complete len:305 (-) Transcript_24880:150-1064(-)